MFDKLKENLEKRGYEVLTFATAAEAAEALNRRIDGKTVGMGGSVTIRQLGLLEKLSGHNTVYWLESPPDGMTVMETRRAGCRSEVYVSSVNGISEAGDIVNIDNTGNRAAAISFGPETVYLIIGRNKIAPDLEGAVWRARNVASPRNAKRLNRNTPCAAKGDRCYDCDSPDRICRNLSVLWRKPAGASYVIVLVDEELGY